MDDTSLAFMLANAKKVKLGGDDVLYGTILKLEVDHHTEKPFYGISIDSKY